MIFDTWVGIIVCFGSLILTLALLRNQCGSLGMPLAYVVGLLLIHVPGAYALVASGGSFQGGFSSNGFYIATGIKLTALGACAFVVGVWVSRRAAVRCSRDEMQHFPFRVDQWFWTFCFVGGLAFSIGLASLRELPSLGAVVVFGSSTWMLGTMLALSFALYKRRGRRVALWTAALAVYPVYVLVFGGFLSYGAAAVILVTSFLIIRAKTFAGSVACLGAILYLGISVFVNYYGNRADLRRTVWSDAGVTERVSAVLDAFSNFQLFNVDNSAHLNALNLRLNQNEFVGLAAERIDGGYVDFLYGQSLWEGAIALVPRVVWPDKPVYGGSPDIVARMTGLNLSPDTSWGVGNVMEFYINFGVPSLIASFFVLGVLISHLDVRSYAAMRQGRHGDALLTFLPCVALIQPNGSLVELAGGAAAALVAAYGWRFAWRHFGQPSRTRPIGYSPRAGA